LGGTNNRTHGLQPPGGDPGEVGSRVGLKGGWDEKLGEWVGKTGVSVEREVEVSN